MTDFPTDYEMQDHGFQGMDRRETITLGPLVSEDGTVCERCGDEFSRGDRTYLVGRVGPTDSCCRYCARADGADEELLDGDADSPGGVA